MLEINWKFGFTAGMLLISGNESLMCSWFCVWLRRQKNPLCPQTMSHFEPIPRIIPTELASVGWFLMWSIMMEQKIPFTSLWYVCNAILFSSQSGMPSPKNSNHRWFWWSGCWNYFDACLCYMQLPVHLWSGCSSSSAGFAQCPWDFGRHQILCFIEIPLLALLLRGFNPALSFT